MTRRTFLKRVSGDILQFAFKNTGYKEDGQSKEIDRYAKKFSRFRIDETRIVNFNKVESDSILHRLNSQYVR